MTLLQLKEFPTGINFKYNWRKYQQLVLDSLDEYLQDNHLHVIAPPGSGKTVLGLEVVLRINQPVLILAPSLAIRNQWTQKFCELFLQTEQAPAWISHNVRQPQLMTIVTYQALHAACYDLKTDDEDLETDEEIVTNDNAPIHNNIDLVVARLLEKQVKTIVVDEAHHLKNEWWHTLIKIKKQLDPIVVGLTATPPYDVTAAEWQRYTELNGPVDVEISVPELIIEGDLCPHQDYVYLSMPTEAEISKIASFRSNIEQLFEEVKNDATLINAIQQHPAWLNPNNNFEWIYANLSCYSASLIFLNANGIPISEEHLEIIDKDIQIPAFDYEWAEILLSFYLYHDKLNFKAFNVHQKLLENKLKRLGALEKNQICFSQNQHITGSLTSSISKLNGIKQIVDFEYQQLDSSLRLVVLTDYIRKEFYDNITDNKFELNKIGVLSIFETLRRNNASGIKIGVLTGSVVIIPKSAYQNFKQKAAHLGLGDLICDAVPFDTNYLLIREYGSIKNHIVDIVTQIFQQGEIEVLIGTKSLLGEGWDAPAINALILASFVGSFVLSNQMRGRAIRTQNGNPDKTGNIWHLCCIDPTTLKGGADLDMLKRRFKGFVGVSLKEDGSIENGLNRLDIPAYLSEEAVKMQNQFTFKNAGNRKALKSYWDKALENGTILTEEIKMPFVSEKGYQADKSFYLTKTIKNLFTALGFGLLEYFWAVLQLFSRTARHLSSAHDIYVYLSVLAFIGVAVFGRLTFKAFRLYVKYRDIAKDIKQIGDALLATLIDMGLIKTNIADLHIDASADKSGAVFCHLDGGTTFERSSFINMLQEIIKPVDNPRYVIIRKSLLFRFLKQKDFHAVPEYIGRNKTTALYFEKQWKESVGACELIFTRTIDGRQLLLKSRIKSLAAQFDDTTEMVNKWK